MHYILETRLRQYIPAVRQWWDNLEDCAPVDTGTYGIEDAPHGLMYRFSRKIANSAIKGVQGFPFLPTACLQLAGIPGGAVKAVEAACLDGQFTIDEFSIVCKSNLPATWTRGQILVFVPTDIYKGERVMGRWVYLTNDEVIALVKGDIPVTVDEKLYRNFN